MLTLYWCPVNASDLRPDKPQTAEQSEGASKVEIDYREPCANRSRPFTER